MALQRTATASCGPLTAATLSRAPPMGERESGLRPGLLPVDGGTAWEHGRGATAGLGRARVQDPGWGGGRCGGGTRRTRADGTCAWVAQLYRPMRPAVCARWRARPPDVKRSAWGREHRRERASRHRRPLSRERPLDCNPGDSSLRLLTVVGPCRSFRARARTNARGAERATRRSVRERAPWAAPAYPPSPPCVACDCRQACLCPACRPSARCAPRSAGSR